MRTQPVTITPKYHVGQLVEFEDKECAFTIDGKPPRRFDTIDSIRAAVSYGLNSAVTSIEITYSFRVVNSHVDQSDIIRVVEDVR